MVRRARVQPAPLQSRQRLASPVPYLSQPGPTPAAINLPEALRGGHPAGVARSYLPPGTVIELDRFTGAAHHARDRAAWRG